MLIVRNLLFCLLVCVIVLFLVTTILCDISEIKDFLIHTSSIRAISDITIIIAPLLMLIVLRIGSQILLIFIYNQKHFIVVVLYNTINILAT